MQRKLVLIAALAIGGSAGGMAEAFQYTRQAGRPTASAPAAASLQAVPEEVRTAALFLKLGVALLLDPARARLVVAPPAGTERAPLPPAHCAAFADIAGARQRAGASPEFRRSVEAFLTPARDCSGPRRLEIREHDHLTVVSMMASISLRAFPRGRQTGPAAAPWPDDDHGIAAVTRTGRHIARRPPAPGVFWNPWMDKD